MSVFFNNAITDAGRLLWPEIQAGGTFTPTKIVMGKGYMPSGKTVRTMTAVADSVKELSLNKKKTLTSGDFLFGAMFSNQDVQTAFYFRELALYAKVVRPDTTETAETLYSYGNAADNAELIPAYSSGSAVERQIDIISYIGNDASVDLTIGTGIYVQKNEYDADMEVIEEAIEDLEEDVNILKTKKLAAHTDYYVNGTTGNDTTGTGAQASPFKTITKAVSMIPKDCGGYTATIHVAAGTYAELVELNNFDNGRVNIYGVLGQTTINGKVSSINCSATIELKEFNITPSTSGDNGLHTDRHAKLLINDITISYAGIGLLTSSLANVYAFKATINNCGEAVRAESGSRVILQEAVGSGNYLGLRASNGATIAVNTHNITGSTVAHFTESGGRIYMGPQTNVPNY